jgi:AcrR family transcriptional regulator
MPRKTDKRQRLIKAAKALIRKQGFHLTTLADIAQEADVPLGNVYYYFKTKEAIGEAVIDSRARELAESMAKWEESTDPRDRLFAFIQEEVASAEETARSGCPMGGLCQELAKQGGQLSDAAAKLMSDTIEWAEKQFSAMGFGASSRDLANQYIALIQGTALLTNTFKEPKLLVNLSESIRTWLDKTVAKGKATAPLQAAEEVA